MKLSFKKAFTLAETLICIAIIGFLFVATMISRKPNDKPIRILYSNVYQNISDAYYNGMGKVSDSPFLLNDPSKVTHSSTKDTGAKLICEGMIQFINSKTDEDYCKDTKLVSAVGRDLDFTDDKVQFIANNGMKFYISKFYQDTADAEASFYLLFVDINGDDRPNSMSYKRDGKLAPDIFAFALLPNLRVVPMGLPEYDKKFMLASSVYYNEQGNPVYNASVPYYQAKIMAWDMKKDKLVKDGKYIYDTSIPFSMNDKIRSDIDEGSILQTQKPNYDSIPYFVSYDETHCAPDASDDTVSAKFDACDVLINEYQK